MPAKIANAMFFAFGFLLRYKNNTKEERYLVAVVVLRRAVSFAVEALASLEVMVREDAIRDLFLECY